MSETTYQELYDYYKSNLENLKEKKNRLESQGNLCAYEICKISELEFHIETLSKTVEACEKQIAKKPINGATFKHIGQCPDCKHVISTRSASSNCQYCGQKLDWGKL